MGQIAIDAETVEELCRTAHRLLFPQVLELCTQFIVRHGLRGRLANVAAYLIMCDFLLTSARWSTCNMFVAQSES